MNDMTNTPGTGLMLPAGTDLAALFKDGTGIDPLIARIEAEVRAHVPDTSTNKGREAIKSLAYKVSRSKTMLDDAGKALNEDARRQINLVDASRKNIRDRLDALRDEARGPHGKQLSYSSASQDVRSVRDAIGARAYDIHGLRYAATAELAAAGCSDEVIAAITGHKTTAMIAKYAGPARQRARASEANAKRGTNAARTENVEKGVESDE